MLPRCRLQFHFTRSRVTRRRHREWNGWRGAWGGRVTGLAACARQPAEHEPSFHPQEQNQRDANSLPSVLPAPLHRAGHLAVPFIRSPRSPGVTSGHVVFRTKTRSSRGNTLRPGRPLGPEPSVCRAWRGSALMLTLSQAGEDADRCPQGDSVPVVQVSCRKGHSLGKKLSGRGEKWQKMAFPLVGQPGL